jgi:inorganic pyrophosphatase
MHFGVSVEIPKGSRNKCEMDHAKQRIRLDQMLFTAATYPSDYGFLPDTLAEDGDPLDALVLLDEPTSPGCQSRCARSRCSGCATSKARTPRSCACRCTTCAGTPSRTSPTCPGTCSTRSRTSSRYKTLEPGKTSETRGWQNRAAAEWAVGEASARAAAAPG